MPFLHFSDLRDALTQILALREGYGSAEELVEWAGRALEQGEDSPSLRMLAGQGANPSEFEVEDLLRKTMHEMGIDPGNAEQRRTDYLRLVCQGVADGSLNARDGLSDLASYWHRDQREDLRFADDLADAIFQLEEFNDRTGLYLELTRDNVEETIRREAQRYLAAIPHPSSD